MKQQLLSDGDRAALQSLIPLAGALGAGTIFALFIGGRRKAGFAVFEVFAIAAVLTAVGTTAYFCISLLHRNEAITSRELTQTATPLIVAVFLLLFMSVFSRLRGSVEQGIAILPLLIASIAVAGFLASSSWTAEPEDTYLVALAILAVGVVIGLVAWGLDRVYSNWERGTQLSRLKRLAGSGYLPEERALSLSIPARDTDLAVPVLSCWTRKGRTFLDPAAAARLAAIVGERWRALGTGEARAPAGATILLAAKAKRSLRVVTFATGGGGERAHELEPNDDGLFDVTELGLV